MSFITDPDRDRVLNAEGHVVVTGGPGCGKTALALRKALVRINKGLECYQKVLFLSFSRAAVARIVQGARKGLPRDLRHQLQIETFHSFCWQIVRNHGYLLGAATPICLLPPHDERALRDGATTGDPAWDAERDRLFLEEGRIAFDLFAPKTLALLHGSRELRRLLAARYPLIIVDEAQDTGTEQWGCIRVLAEFVQIVCLADLDQQIYDFRPDVSPDRLNHILAAINPIQIDLGGQNKRSPDVEIVQFGNDILRDTPRGGAYKGVSQFSFQSEASKRDRAIRSAIGMVYKQIEKTIGTPPESIGYFTNWGKGVSIIAHALQGDDSKRIIPHRVVMDEAEVLLATRVIALCLEPIEDKWATLAHGLGLISSLYRARGSITNIRRAERLDCYAENARKHRIRGNAHCPSALNKILEYIHSNVFTGNPAQDWLTVRRHFENSGVSELQLVAKLVIYLMAFNRGRRISDNLAEVWQRCGMYKGARGLIEDAITQDQIVGSDGDLLGINVMTMHKSKGKEFDGVIILHLGNEISPFSRYNEKPPYTKSRRLLRVAITRARHHVLMLTDAYNPSPLLKGHKL